jgi:hypothetical protein
MIPATKQLQTYALDHTATGIDMMLKYNTKLYKALK